MRALGRIFLQGLIVLVPISLTVYIFYGLFITIDRFGRAILGLWVSERVVAGIGFLVTLALVFLAGYVSSRWLGQSVYEWVQRQLLQSRLTRGIYGTIHDTLSAIFGRKKVFNQVALIDFPQLGYKRIGFVTQDSLGIPDLDKKEMVIVYCPHSFQISGNMFIVPSKNVQIIDMPAETALKLIMSGGMVSDHNVIGR